MSARSEVSLFLWIGALVALAAGMVWFCLPAPIHSGAPRPYADPSVRREALMGDRCRIDGPATAPFVLVAFVDLQCPNCRQAHAWIEQYKAKRKGQLAVVMHHFRSTAEHRHEPMLARAAEAAGRQGRFWQMCAAIFDMQDQLSTMDARQADRAVTRLATRLRLDPRRFAQDRNSPEAAAAYAADIELARRLGLFMPGFFFFGPHGPPVRLLHLMQMREWLDKPSHWRQDPQ
jgi:hypothetical protein